jgi:hypothetical protein
VCYASRIFLSVFDKASSSFVFQLSFRLTSSTRYNCATVRVNHIDTKKKYLNEKTCEFSQSGFCTHVWVWVVLDHRFIPRDSHLP